MSPLCGALLKIVLFLVQIWIKALKIKINDACTFFSLFQHPEQFASNITCWTHSVWQVLINCNSLYCRLVLHDETGVHGGHFFIDFDIFCHLICNPTKQNNKLAWNTHVALTLAAPRSVSSSYRLFFTSAGRPSCPCRDPWHWKTAEYKTGNLRGHFWHFVLNIFDFVLKRPLISIPKLLIY